MWIHSFFTVNARNNGLGGMAVFLRVFAKMVTACPIPLACAC